ncbi:MAG TPA: hypothetical protein VG605_09545, partial [Puia sp.]|nr:hypothetical protein [Puia sp.]
ALVLGDYEAVMPLTWRQKYGIRYLYQPPFTQQTGIFAPFPLSTGLIDAFLQNARQHFRFAEIFLNYGNAQSALAPHANYILRLDAPYTQIAAQYRKDLQRNLKLAARSPLHYSTDLDLATALEGYRREYAARTPHLRPADYDNFERLCLHLQTRGQIILRAVKGPTSEPDEGRVIPSTTGPGEARAIGPREAHTTVPGKFLATALLLRDEHRLYLIESTTPPAGRKTEANHFLLDQLIREFAGNDLTLDFEGSDLPGIAHFYKNFGAIDQPYYFYRHNRLPWFVNLFKSLTNTWKKTLT